MGLFNLPTKFRYITQVSASFFRTVAAALNGMRGENGCTVKKGSNGEIIVKLGDDDYAMRTLTTCSRTFADDGTMVLAFTNVNALCSRVESEAYNVHLASQGGGGGEGGEGGMTVQDPPIEPVVLGDDGYGFPLGEGEDDEPLDDEYSPTDEDQDGLSIWVVTRVRYDHEGSKILYMYLRKLTWPKVVAPIVSIERRVIIDEAEDEEIIVG